MRLRKPRNPEVAIFSSENPLSNLHPQGIRTFETFLPLEGHQPTLEPVQGFSCRSKGLGSTRHSTDPQCFENGRSGGSLAAIDATEADSAIPAGGCIWRWRDEQLVLLPDRGIWREASRDLLVADLHLGKAEVFQAFGIPVPSDEDRGTLGRLEQICTSCSPERIIILGDLIHGRQGLTPRLMHDLATLSERLETQILLVGGNHDRDLRMTMLPRQSSFRLGSLWLSHEPENGPATADLLNICGHIHPAATLRQGADRLRLPCFAYDEHEQRMLIPAFGELTGGHDCGHRYRKWLVAEGAIVPWLTPEPQPRKRRQAR